MAAIVACQSDRNMNGGEAARGDSGRATAAVTSGTTRSTASNAGTTPSDSTSHKVTVLFFGTSLTAGYGLDPSQAFPVLVEKKAAAEKLPIIAINAGLSGETSAGALRRIDWVLKRPVDIVVLETGGNDALRALDADALKANLMGIIERIRKAQPKATILLAEMEAPPNFGARYTASFRAAYTSVAKREGLTLLPFLLDRVAGKPELNQDDGIHPNVAGEKIVADNVWRSLKPAVEQAYMRRLEAAD